MWKTTNYKGEQVWHSEEEYNKLLTALERIRASLRTAIHANNGDKFFENVDNAYQIAKDVLK
jgi:hypothetical protein